MTRTSDDLHSIQPPVLRRRTKGGLACVLVGCGALLLGACGGGDDDDTDADATTTTQAAASPTTTTRPEPASTSTTTTTQPPIEYVTEGATVVVANASGINGAAGRMSDALAQVGFTTGEPGNSSEGQLETTRIYHDPANESAKPVADSLREALGGGEIEVLELPVPAPTATGEIGDATVLILMGNDTADKSLDELQGRVTTPTESTEEGTAESSDESTGESEESTSESTDESSEESSAG